MRVVWKMEEGFVNTEVVPVWGCGWGFSPDSVARFEVVTGDCVRDAFWVATVAYGTKDPSGCWSGIDGVDVEFAMEQGCAVVVGDVWAKDVFQGRCGEGGLIGLAEVFVVTIQLAGFNFLWVEDLNPFVFVG